MAETDSTVSGTVTFETDDDLSETNLGAAAAQGNRVDYVERGCGFSVNHTNDTITIGSTGTRANYAIVENPSSHVAWHLYPDQDTDIALPNAAATNYVFIAYDESSDAISYHIDDDDTAPSEPSLKIGTVDTSADTSTETNRNPDGTFETTTTGSVDISGIADDTTTIALSALLSDLFKSGVLTQPTEDVSTSAVEILNQALFAQNGLLGIVQGSDNAAAANRFVDVIVQAPANAPTVVHSETNGSPSGRTYAHSGGITLAMASGTYDVEIIVIATRTV